MRCLCGIKTLKRASLLVLPFLLSLFGLLFCSLPANALSSSVSVTPTGRSWSSSGLDCYLGSGRVSSVNNTDCIVPGGSNDGFLGVELYNTIAFRKGYIYEVEVFVKSTVMSSDIQPLQTGRVISNGHFVVLDTSVSSQQTNSVSPYSYTTSVRYLLLATDDYTGRLNTVYGNFWVLYWTSLPVNQVNITVNGVFEYEPLKTSSDISNQTQDLIDYNNNQQSSGASDVQDASDDALNDINDWNSDFLSAFTSLFSGLGTWFSTITSWATPNASVGCAFSFSFLGVPAGVDLCSVVPSDVLAVIHNVSAVFAFFIIIMILRSIFEDVMSFIGGVR